MKIFDASGVSGVCMRRQNLAGGWPRSWLALCAGCAQIASLVVSLFLWQPLMAGASAYDDLLQAVERNDLATTTRLLQRGMDINTSDRNGNTLLMIAARNGATEILDFLLTNRVSLLKQNKYGDTAIMLAALNGRRDAVLRLLQAGAGINPETGWTPLLYAAFNGHQALVKDLLDAGAAIDARAPNGDTALMLAARNGHEEVLSLLLERGANPLLPDRAGLGARQLAEQAAHQNLVLRLQQAEERWQKLNKNISIKSQ